MSEIKNGKYTSVDGTEKWYENDVLHRENAPAVIGDNGKSLLWFKHGVMHRDDGPAVVLTNSGTKIEKWFLNGQASTEKEVTQRWLAIQEKKQLEENMPTQTIQVKNKIKV
jgi:hypothetical protein